MRRFITLSEAMERINEEYMNGESPKYGDWLHLFDTEAWEIMWSAGSSF